MLEDFTAEWCAVRCKRDEQVSNVRTVLQQLPDVAFVMPAGAFTFLLNYAHHMQQQWTIPFEIKLIDGRKVLIMDSRHPPTKLSTHARKVKAYKLLAKSFMTFKTVRQHHPETSKIPAKDKEESTEGSFKPLLFDEYMKTMAHRKSSLVKEKIRESRFYQAWKLKDPADDVHHLLVGFRQDCYESFRKMRVFINISIKIEYQPEFGAEQMTLAELLHEWCRQLLRPNSKTMRLRINSTTSTIISHRYLELRDIEEELYRLYSVKPANLITNVWKMLKLMGNFPDRKSVV